ncbi:MAG: glycosyltransferase family 2 protein [Bacteroidota bacterium]|nr:glycosyltransferase family 2 protein [Bacteroidota bacterium]
MNNVEYPLVSIVTVNYNQTEITCQLLESLRRISYPNIEILIVDNASELDDPAPIKIRFPEITLITSSENLGFAGGNNLAIHKCKGNYILLLNNDTEVEPGFLEPLVDKMRSNPGIGAVSPKIRYFFQPHLLQYAGFEPMSPITLRQHAIGFNQEDKGGFDQDRLTDFGFGAALMVSRNVIDKVGLMSEIFFLYYEEMDWMERIRKAGFEIWYVNNSLVYHKDSVTTGQLSRLKTYYLNRGRLLYMRRNIFGAKFLLSVLYHGLIVTPKEIFIFVFKGRFDLLIAYCKAINWHLFNIFSKEVHENPGL